MFGLVVFVQNISRYFVGTLKEREREREMARDTISPPNAMPLETVSPPVVVVVFVVGAVIVVVVAAAPTVVVPGLYSRSF